MAQASKRKEIGNVWLSYLSCHQLSKRNTKESRNRNDVVGLRRR